MKKIVITIISLSLFISMISSLLCFHVHADDIAIPRCVTWLLGIEEYTSQYYKDGEIPLPPNQIPIVDSNEYFYNFVGWQLLTSPEEVIAYRAEPAIAFGEKFKQKPFEPIHSELVFAARFSKAPKKFAVNNDTYVDISDVTALLNHLSGANTPVGPGADADGDGVSSIMDVTKLLNYLTTGEE